MQNPRGVLQLAITSKKKELQDSDLAKRDKAKAWLDEEGWTVDQLVDNGWHVLPLPESAFVELGFTVLEPEADGHQNVLGERQDFKTHARALIKKSEIVSRQDLLDANLIP